MNTTKNGSDVLQENKEPMKKPLTVGDIEGMLKRDVESCLLMLQSIREDAGILRAVAMYMHGKHMNVLHQAELAAQEELKL